MGLILNDHTILRANQNQIIRRSFKTLLRFHFLDKINHYTCTFNEYLVQLSPKQKKTLSVSNLYILLPLTDFDFHYLEVSSEYSENEMIHLCEQHCQHLDHADQYLFRYYWTKSEYHYHIQITALDKQKQEEYIRLLSEYNCFPVYFGNGLETLGLAMMNKQSDENISLDFNNGKFHFIFKEGNLIFSNQSKQSLLDLNLSTLFVDGFYLNEKETIFDQMNFIEMSIQKFNQELTDKKSLRLFSQKILIYTVIALIIFLSFQLFMQDKIEDVNQIRDLVIIEKKLYADNNKSALVNQIKNDTRMTNFSGILELIGKSVPDRITLSEIFYDQESNKRIIVKGKSRNNDDVLTFVDNIRKLQYFKNLIIKEIKDQKEQNMENPVSSYLFTLELITK